jgi:hypothetical protein
MFYYVNFYALRCIKTNENRIESNLCRRLPGSAHGASLATSKLLRKGKDGMMARLGVTGMTGPGEPWFNASVGVAAAADSVGGGGGGRNNARASASDLDGGGTGLDFMGDEDEAEDYSRLKRMMPSVFSELRAAEEEEPEEDLGLDEDEDDASSLRDRKAKFGWNIDNYKDPMELDTSATAAAVVQAWAFRLKGTVSPCGLTSTHFVFLLVCLLPYLFP